MENRGHAGRQSDIHSACAVLRVSKVDRVAVSMLGTNIPASKQTAQHSQHTWPTKSPARHAAHSSSTEGPAAAGSIPQKVNVLISVTYCLILSEPCM
jgi:hypothetical protein